LQNYQNNGAAQAIEDFVVKDLSTWYIRRIRGRVGPSVSNGEDKLNAYRTLYGVLLRLTKLLSPFIPFLAEEVYQTLIGPQQEIVGERSDVVGAVDSVHLANWPLYHEYLTDGAVLGWGGASGDGNCACCLRKGTCGASRGADQGAAAAAEVKS